ncbi:MAG: flagellar export chaperone FliS [Armatimonadetes bacterium]|nr:flagellar export chaperone FliS [Armatimonadota bacterium]
MKSTKGRGIAEYRKAAVNTASPLQLVLMLYDAALRNCETGKCAIEEGDLEKQNDHLGKAQRIISELTASLDMEQGGEIAQNLFGLYTYCLNELSRANTEDKADSVDNCTRVLSELRTSWQQIHDRQPLEAGSGG